MESKSSKSDLESRLDQTAEAMSDHLGSIQEEVASTGGSVRDWIVANPVKSVGGMLATGLAVGLLFGGGRSRARGNREALVDASLKALRREGETAPEDGEEPEAALEAALRDRIPLVICPQNAERSAAGTSEERSVLRKGAGIVLRTGVSLLAREVIESLLANVDVEGIVEEEPRE